MRLIEPRRWACSQRRGFVVLSSSVESLGSRARFRRQAIYGDFAEDVSGELELFDLDELVGCVALVDRAGAEDDGWDAGGGDCGSVSGIGDADGSALAAEALHERRESVGKRVIVLVAQTVAIHECRLVIDLATADVDGGDELNQLFVRSFR